MSKLWKRFSRFTEQGYCNMISGGKDNSVWHKAFHTLVKAIEEERSKNPDFGKELFQVDDETDFEYGVEDWLLDYLDELEMWKMNDKRYKVCEKIISLFAWEEQSPADYRFQMASALDAQGKVDEAVAFCEKWHEENPEEDLSTVALIYAKANAKDYDGAEQLVEKYIPKGEECTEDNELVYRAAVRLYEAKGDKKTAAQMKESLEKYEEEVDQELMEEFDGWDDNEFGDMDEWDDDEFYDMGGWEDDEFDDMDEWDDDEYDDMDEWDDDEYDDMDEWDDFEDDDERMGEILPFKGGSE